MGFGNLDWNMRLAFIPGLWSVELQFSSIYIILEDDKTWKNYVFKYFILDNEPRMVY